VALKVLRPFLASPEHVQRLAQEARAIGALNHPNVLAVYDVGTQEGRPYIVSELLHGESLRQRLSRGALPARKAIDYAIQIAHGLEPPTRRHLPPRHQAREPVPHADGRVKILDFGLAKVMPGAGADRHQLTYPHR